MRACLLAVVLLFPLGACASGFSLGGASLGQPFEAAGLKAAHEHPSWAWARGRDLKTALATCGQPRAEPAMLASADSPEPSILTLGCALDRQGHAVVEIVAFRELRKEAPDVVLAGMRARWGKEFGLKNVDRVGFAAGWRGNGAQGDETIVASIVAGPAGVESSATLISISGAAPQ